MNEAFEGLLLFCCAGFCCISIGTVIASATALNWLNRNFGSPYRAGRGLFKSDFLKDLPDLLERNK